MQGIPADVLFVGGNVEPPTCAYLHKVFAALRTQGITRFVEPCAGAFAMSLLAAEAGFAPSHIEASDVQLFSTAIGTMLAGRTLEPLGVRIDGAPLDLSRLTPAQQVARILYWQVRIRAEGKAHEYWNELAHDLTTRQAAHEADITRQVEKIAARLTGINYAPLDAWDHLKAVMDDPKTVVSINAPNYTGGFERFYDMKGRLVWDEPTYAVWDGKNGLRKLMDWSKDKPGCLLSWEQTAPGKSSGMPVYALHNRPGVHIYLLTNQPERIIAAAGGLKVVPLKGQDLEKLKNPTLDPDYAVRYDSQIHVQVLPAKVANYYRSLWIHKLDYTGIATGCYVGVFVDGYIAGMIGYDYATIYRPYPGAGVDVRGALLLTFAVGAPHKWRLTRLVTMIALSSDTLRKVLRPDLAVLVERIITIELTKYPEAKGLRGLMKIQMRKPDPKYGNRLVYGTPVSTLALTDIPKVWRKKEDAWQQSRLEPVGP